MFHCFSFGSCGCSMCFWCVNSLFVLAAIFVFHVDVEAENFNFLSIEAAVVYLFTFLNHLCYFSIIILLFLVNSVYIFSKLSKLSSAGVKKLEIFRHELQFVFHLLLYLTPTIVLLLLECVLLIFFSFSSVLDFFFNMNNLLIDYIDDGYAVCSLFFHTKLHFSQIIIF